MSVRTMAMGPLALALACLLLNACVSTSPYARPVGATLFGGPVFKYGNFCGPGVPNNPHPMSQPRDRRAFLERIEPVNWLDSVCKAHDICYEERGHDDPACDYAMATRLTVADFYPADHEAYALGRERNMPQACSNLAQEMNVAILRKGRRLLAGSGTGARMKFGEALDSVNAIGAVAKAKGYGAGYASEAAEACRPLNIRQIEQCVSRVYDRDEQLMQYGSTPHYAYLLVDERADPVCGRPPVMLKPHPARSAACLAAVSDFADATDQVFAPIDAVKQRWRRYAVTDPIRNYLREVGAGRMMVPGTDSFGRPAMNRRAGLSRLNRYERRRYGQLDATFGADTSRILKDLLAAVEEADRRLNSSSYAEVGRRWDATCSESALQNERLGIAP